MAIRIKRIGVNDAAVFGRVAAEVFDEPVVPARLSAYLKDSGNLMVLAMASDEVVGQVAAVIHRHPDKPTELYIDEVGVTPHLRKQGVAKSMMQEMLRWGKELGCEEAWVGTEPDNFSARALYQRNAEAAPMLIYEWNL
jgi:ribosomal protein S18 acetylase RimI-like enzyme